MRGSFLGPPLFLFCLCSVLEKLAFCCRRRHVCAVHEYVCDRTAGEKARSRDMEGALIPGIVVLLYGYGRNVDGVEASSS